VARRLLWSVVGTGVPKEEIMAKTRARRPLDELRTSIGRMQREGERMAARIQREARSLFSRGRTELLKDVRKVQADLQRRAGKTIQTLEAKVMKELHAARSERVAGLEKRVEELERRLGELGEKAA
jgi:vacuolar-type H+-ATPase subunit E/Vma4